MLEGVLDHIHNYFVVKDGVHKGEFSISSSTISLDFLQNGQYFKIVGSVFNDGVYKYPVNTLVNETFVGEIWAMAVPPAVIALSSEIENWNTVNPVTPYTSESFGGYSYTKGTPSLGKNPVVMWQDVFRDRLDKWRKLS